MPTDTVLINPVDRRTVETLYRQAKDWAFQPHPNLHKVAVGMRVARDRPALFMKTLEACLEVLDQMGEDQYGQTRREMNAPDSQRVAPTVINFFREAYLAADRNEPTEHFGYIYAAVAAHAGYIV